MTPGNIALVVFQCLLGSLAFAELGFIKTALQNRHGLFLVLMLASAGLADSDYAGRDMRDTDGGVGLLNVLTAGAGGAERVNAQIGRIDFDFERIVDFGNDEHRSKRSMTACVGVERALAN